jgi:hypothetical protein
MGMPQILAEKLVNHAVRDAQSELAQSYNRYEQPPEKADALLRLERHLSAIVGE